MKPKDLKFPFPESGPRCQLFDRILYIPKFSPEERKTELLSWEREDVFGNDHPVIVEIGSGNGHWICEQAKENPHLNYVAIDIRFDRVKKIWSKRANENLSNLFIVAGEAFSFCSHFVKEGSVKAIHINFPDPWPKRRHEKHRLIKSTFVEEIARILIPEGRLVFVTDDFPYLEWATSTFLADNRFRPLFPAPYYVEESIDSRSTFEALWRKLGRKIYSFQVEKSN